MPQTNPLDELVQGSADELWAQTAPLTIVTDGAAPRRYPGYSLTLEIHETTIWDVSVPNPATSSPQPP